MNAVRFLLIALVLAFGGTHVATAGDMDTVDQATQTRYHSLIVPESSLPDELTACAWTNDADHPRELMGLRHQQFPVHAVQFHPESFLTPDGYRLLQNFLDL